MAPKIIGGDGVDCVGSVGVKRVDEAVSLKENKSQMPWKRYYRRRAVVGGVNGKLINLSVSSVL